MDFSWFVIPWRDYGRLLVRGPGGEVAWRVGPFEDGDTDVLQGRSAGGIVQDIRLGDTGGPFTADQLEFRLHATRTGIAVEPTGAGVGRVLSLNWGTKLVGRVLDLIG